RLLGQSDRPRPRRVAGAMVCVGDPRYRDPCHRARGVAGRPGPQRCAQSEAEEPMSDTEAILSLEHLGVSLPKGADRPLALSDVSLAISSNEILCVVGQSGSGKSMMANAIMRLLPNEVTIDSGRVMFEGRDLASATVADMRRVRGAGIAMIFQEPMTALNPLRTIGDQIAEMFSIHTDLSKADINAKVLALLED